MHCLLLFAFVLFCVAIEALVVKRDPSRIYYTLHFPQPNDVTHLDARHIAQEIGIRYEGPVGELSTYHLVSVPKHQADKRADQDDIIHAFEQMKHSQTTLAKRHLDTDLTPWHRVHRIDRQVLRQRTRRAVLPRAPIMTGELLFEDAQKTLDIQDPGFGQQWHLINQVNLGHDINVTGVWKQGINGEGTTVAILDDGLDYESKDLMDNFFAEGSYDFNDHADLPTPKLWNDYHGTRCAGQIAAVKNDVCGIGIAYKSKVSGVRILSGEITDVDEAAALNYKYQENDIFSCSWGPPDDGKTMEAPTGILADAFINGIQNGRGGKGSVYVFATGNGGELGDNCNFDGYTNSIYTITVGALDHLDQHPGYAERCSAQLVVTYSSGGGKSIYTTNHGNEQCTDIHGGTSAAAPNAAGILALVLSVRPDLTWRDVQHLCVLTAIPVDEQDEDWATLPSGRKYNHKYGYGKLDAYAIVEAAKAFKNVNRQTYLELPVSMEKTAIPDTTGENHKKPLQSTILVTQEMLQAAGLSRLEHITATINIEHQRRGDIQILLKSPQDVTSELAAVRPGDGSPDGIVNWKFMSVKHWDEEPVGNWSLLVFDELNKETTGQMLNWTLTLFGELEPDFQGEPVHLPDVQHETSNNQTHAVTSASSFPSPTPTDSRHGSRPTRVKPNPASDTSSSASSSSSSSSSSSTPDTSTSTPVDTVHEDEKAPSAEDAAVTPNAAPSTQSSSVSGFIYGIVGTASIMGLATIVYLQKRNTWRASPAATPANGMTAAEYEFDELKHEDDSEEEQLDDDDEHSDGRPLLSNQSAS
ncbi:hypothetical protein DM01DRAFT_1289941 [Hesseltinella vesiculosa]|uniref:P/Homo B domain-containing protein n=1 Tax=Hesseltinella vesiculosa TaxID=101127 RepID=A0A1X2GDK8_9FUNG|nr:hypothetical protein DM01DRAFT_1289941 [Hesseltinella vesiculosa]